MSLRLRLGALALAAAAFAPPASAIPAPGTYVVHVIDVGTGLSVFVEGADFTLLYDAGSQDNSGGGRDNRVLTYLRHVRPGMTRIDHLILSHPHQDHLEMMDEVLEAYDVDNVWDSGSFNPTCGYRKFLRMVREEDGVAYHTARAAPQRVETFSKCRGGRDGIRPASSAISLGTLSELGDGARMMILHANDSRSVSDLNNGSVVVRLDLDGRRLLLVGDAEAGNRDWPPNPPTPRSAEGMLLQRFRPELRSDILVVGHHGSRTSSRTEFLDAVGAHHYVISSGPTRYDDLTLPDREIETLLRDRRDTESLWVTYKTDAVCVTGPPKIGKDDEKPGGCDHVRIDIGPAGRIAGDYFRDVD